MERFILLDISLQYHCNPQMGPVMLSVLSIFIAVYTLLISSRYLTFSAVVGNFHDCTFFQTATNVHYPPMASNIDAYVLYTQLYAKHCLCFLSHKLYLSTH